MSLVRMCSITVATFAREFVDFSKEENQKAVTTLVSFVLDKLLSTSQTHLKRPTNILKLCDG